MSRFALAFAILALANIVVSAQEPLKGNDRTEYEALKHLDNPPDTAAARAILAKQAKFLVGSLSDPKRVDHLADTIENAIRELRIPRADSPKKEVTDEQLKFNIELGRAMVEELKPLLKDPKPGLTENAKRVNAARMLSVVAQIGCDDVTPVALAILADPKEQDGVKFYALMTLKNIFAFVVDPKLPELSVFAKENHLRKENRAVERQAIVALCNFVTRVPDLTGKSQEEIDGIRYLRNEAIRALGCVRTHRVRFNQEWVARPGLILLKVANKDGIVPEPNLKERAEAVYGFTQLFPVTRANVDREINIDYAADRLGAAMLDIIAARDNKLDPVISVSLPWIYTATRWELGLKTWQKNVDESKLNGAATAKALYDRFKTDIFEPIKPNQPGVGADTNNFRTWLIAHPATSKSLYQDEPENTIKLIAQ